MTIRHPKPSIIAKQLRHLADTLDDEGDRAIARAVILASRGYPSSTTGSGVSKGRADSTSTERAAGLAGDGKDDDPKLNLTPPPFAGLDDKLAKQLRVVWAASVQAEQTIAIVNSHASDDDPIPAGTGFCDACDLFCRPTAKNPNFRLRTGLCPTDHKAWRRWLTTYPGCTKDQFVYYRWLERNPEGTADEFLAWRKAKLNAA